MNIEKGFTLIEAMIVVAIFGILAAIAYPSYVGQVARSARADGLTELVGLANKQEQYYNDQRRYAKTMQELTTKTEYITEAGHYKITVAYTDAAKDFTLTASAQGTQASRDKDCASMSINYLGQKTAKTSGGADNSAKCWEK